MKPFKFGNLEVEDAHEMDPKFVENESGNDADSKFVEIVDEDTSDDNGV